ncbi:VOC family protein [Leptospira venezuelensis]|uniref:bleomycin resistance protein n=1 Tax=Leptospira venezuelensis TaxID=1958811 RepID=UPI000A3C328B|nr:VOC family protein [Leptospira venezuelensis]
MKDPKLLSIVPQLPVLDLSISQKFYTEVLGFELRAEYSNLLIFFLDGQELHLWGCDDPKIPEVSSCYIRVQNIESYFAKYKSAIHPKGTLEDKPWGMREFYVLDPDKNLLKFGEPI